MATSQTNGLCPTLAEQAAFFDDWNTRHRLAGFDAMEPESQARGRRVLEMIQSLRLDRPTILEVGCGTGWLTEKLARLGKVTAIDLSAKAIEVAKQRGFEAAFLAGDIYTQDFSPSQFDVTVCVETVSSVPDQPRFIGKLASLTRPGGHLVVTAQNKFVYERRSDIGPPRAGQIRQWLSRRQLHRLLSNDFRVLESVTVLPRGDRGILRIVNSPKVNWLLRRFLSESSVDRVKESLGLGHSRIVLAERRS
jgi:2-polyprenyl-3-methyl-5-hydroxy-6-metoxy-1,4-benzoquinol methylase